MADRNTSWGSGTKNRVPIAAATTVYYGHMVARNATGYLIPAADFPGIKVCGMCSEPEDNASGADGAKYAMVKGELACWFVNDGTNPVTLADLGKFVYVKDSETVCVAAGATNNIVAGKALELDSVKGVKVYLARG